MKRQVTGPSLLPWLLSMGLLVGCGGISGNTPTPTPDAWETWDQSYVSVTGRVVPVERAELAFLQPGHVLEVLVEEGDRVAPGELLARLDDAQLLAAISQSEAGVAQAEAQLAQLQAGARQEKIAVTRAAVAEAREAVASAELGILSAEDQVAIAEAGLQAAEAQLAQVVNGPLPEEIEIARQQVELAKAQRYAAQAQRDAMGGLREGAPNAYELGLFEAAEGNAFAAENQVTIAELQYDLLKQGARPEQIASAKAQVAQAEASLGAARTAVDVAKGQRDAAEARLAQAEAQLALMMASATPEELALAEAGVAEAQAALEQAQAALSQARLRSPVRGTVAQVDLRVGELAPTGVPVISVGSLDAFQIETTDMDEIDAARVSVGDEVELLFDALPELEVTGTVTSVALKAGEGLGGTAYQVVIALDGPAEGLRWGMTASVDIVVDDGAE
jgi:HlyD family secretion protein